MGEVVGVVFFFQDKTDALLSRSRVMRLLMSKRRELVWRPETVVRAAFFHTKCLSVPLSTSLQLTQTLNHTGFISFAFQFSLSDFFCNAPLATALISDVQMNIFHPHRYIQKIRFH